MRKFMALAAAATLVAAPASAQIVGGGLITVNISNNDIANDIANDLDITLQDVLDIGSVQVPIGIAAAVCGVNANVLAAQRNAGDNDCDATTNNAALTRIVQRQINRNNQ